MRAWSSPFPYDLTRTSRRVSVPTSFKHLVPEAAGAYVIYSSGSGAVDEAILDIGECGPRPNSSPRGLSPDYSPRA
jgi:hypothetical protein